MQTLRSMILHGIRTTRSCLGDRCLWFQFCAGRKVFLWRLLLSHLTVVLISALAPSMNPSCFYTC